MSKIDGVSEGGQLGSGWSSGSWSEWSCKESYDSITVQPVIMEM